MNAAKPLVVYHAECTDGFGAAFAAWMKYGENADYIPAKYGQTVEELISAFPDATTRPMFILDFSFPRYAMVNIFNKFPSVTWLDHHKTGFEAWNEESLLAYKNDTLFQAKWNHNTIILDNNRSGAMIAWNYFVGAETPLLIRLIDDYDRWQHEVPNSKAIFHVLNSYRPWTFTQWKQEFLPMDIGSKDAKFGQTAAYVKLRDEGEAILRAESNTADRLMELVRECVIKTSDNKTHMGLSVNSPVLKNEIGSKLAVNCGTFGLVWHMEPDSKVKASLRSIGDYDVEAIAKDLGGGGHKNASAVLLDMKDINFDHPMQIWVSKSG